MRPHSLGGWRTASRSANTGQCVEIGAGAGVFGIRDSKNREGGTLVIDEPSFRALLTAVRSDRIR